MSGVGRGGGRRERCNLPLFRRDGTGGRRREGGAVRTIFLFLLLSFFPSPSPPPACRVSLQHTDVQSVGDNRRRHRCKSQSSAWSNPDQSLLLLLSRGEIRFLDVWLGSLLPRSTATPHLYSPLFAPSPLSSVECCSEQSDREKGGKEKQKRGRRGKGDLLTLSACLGSSLPSFLPPCDDDARRSPLPPSLSSSPSPSSSFPPSYKNGNRKRQEKGFSFFLSLPFLLPSPIPTSSPPFFPPFSSFLPSFRPSDFF